MNDCPMMPGWNTYSTALPAELEGQRSRITLDPIYAGFWRRFLALVIDRLALAIPLRVSHFALSHVLDEWVADSFDDRNWWLALFVWLSAYFIVTTVIDWLYCAGLESSAQQSTLGKRALGIVVTDLSGRRVSFVRATARYFSHYVTLMTLGVGYLIQPFTRHRQALHDLIAGTLVVRS